MHDCEEQRQNQSREKSLHRVPPKSEVLDFAKPPATDVIDEAANGHSPGNPGMSAELLQLVADILFDVLEGVEEGGGDSGGSSAILDSGAQVLFASVHHAAISVVAHHEFLCSERMS